MAIKNAVQFTLNFANQLGHENEEGDTASIDCNDQETTGSRERLFSDPSFDNAKMTSTAFESYLSGRQLENVPKNLTWDNYSIKMGIDEVSINNVL